MAQPAGERGLAQDFDKRSLPEFRDEKHHDNRGVNLGKQRRLVLSLMEESILINAHDILWQQQKITSMLLAHCANHGGNLWQPGSPSRLSSELGNLVL